MKTNELIEEILLAFLRANNKVSVQNIDKKEESAKDIYTISFNVDKDFESTISKPNQFFEFFNKKQSVK